METALARKIRPEGAGPCAWERAPSTGNGGSEFMRAWGSSGVPEATRLVDLCLEAGLTFFDSADIYSSGVSEEILGQAIARRRNKVLISTKATFRHGDGPNDVGSSRQHLIEACEGSLKRLGTDHIDLYQMHGFDALTPVEETLRALENLVRSGKVRYIGCSTSAAAPDEEPGSFRAPGPGALCGPPGLLQPGGRASLNGS